MKLYDSPRAPNPRRVRWFMAEKGIDDLEIVTIDLLGGEQRSPEYVAMAGIAQAPALTLEDGTTITESVAICRYLESLHPQPNMFGRDAKETAVLEMWLRRAEILASNPLMLVVRHTHPALAVLETQVEAVAESNRGAAEQALAFFDRALADREFIACDRITLADGVLFIGLDFARMVRFRVPEEHRNLTRWLNMMRSRPSAAAGAG